MMRALMTIAAAVILGACGRIGFDVSGDASGPGDPSARLALIELWAAPTEPLAAPMIPGFDPQIGRYAVDVGLALQSVRISAIPLEPTTSITIDGISVDAGELSAPLALGLGATTIAVTGTSTGGARASYIVDITRAGPLAQDVYAKASNTEANDYFGYSVALSGDTLAVGARSEGSSATGAGGNQADNGASNSGAVYVFTRTAGAWSQQAYLKASNTETNDQFGFSVALSGDTLAVGTRFEDSSATGAGGNQADNGAPDSGAVYVFTRTTAAWSQQAYLKASNTEPNDYFGFTVALSGDTLAVGAPGEDSSATGADGNQADNGAISSGAVYVFTRTAGAWSQQGYLKASNTETNDAFGFSVALSGGTLAVGAEEEGSSATGAGGNQADNGAISSGAVYVFTRTAGAWSQQAYLKASNTETGDRFGYSVALSGDTVAVGAYGEDSSATGVGGNQADNGAMFSGAVYVFTRSAGAWSQQAYLKASYVDLGDSFGTSVSLSGDTLAVSAFSEGSSATGIGGNQVDNGAPNSGAVYVFTRTTGLWSQLAYLKASNTGTDDFFGSSVALSGDTLAVGAYGEDGSATGVGGNQADNGAIESGAVYVFH